MTLVVDASVALKWVLDEVGSAAAAALLSSSLIAPELWISEAANGLWKQVRRSELKTDEAARYLDYLRMAPVSAEALTPLVDDALRYALLLQHPVYDCFYLALALQRGCEVVTADRRFVAAASRERAFADRVRMLGS